MVIEIQDVIINHSFKSIENPQALNANRDQILENRHVIALLKDQPRSVQQFLD